MRVMISKEYCIIRTKDAKSGVPKQGQQRLNVKCSSIRKPDPLGLVEL